MKSSFSFSLFFLVVFSLTLQAQAKVIQVKTIDGQQVQVDSEVARAALVESSGLIPTGKRKKLGEGMAQFRDPGIKIGNDEFGIDVDSGKIGLDIYCKAQGYQSSIGSTTPVNDYSGFEPSITLKPDGNIRLSKETNMGLFDTIDCK